MVGNPCNTNCLIAAANAPEIADDRWFAMTMLDENRGRSQLAQRAGVDVTEVRDLAVWGNHSSTQFPDFYHATIGGRPAPDVIDDEGWLQSDFIGAVQQRGRGHHRGPRPVERGQRRQRGDRHGAQRQPADRRDLQRGRPRAGETHRAMAFRRGWCSDIPCGQRRPARWRSCRASSTATWAQSMIDATRDELLEEREAVKDLLP